MSASEVSGHRHDHSQLHSTINQTKAVRQDLHTLRNSLQNGDITSARSAYADLQDLILKAAQAPRYQNAQASEKLTGPVTNDLSALGQALTSGDIIASQTAAITLQRDIRNLASNGAINMQHKLQAAYVELKANDVSALPADLKA